MRVTHITQRISEEASGLSVCVPHLCENLAASGEAAVRLLCLGGGHAGPNVDVVAHTALPPFQSFGVSPAQVLHLCRRASQDDVVHNHGLWAFGNIASGLVVPGRQAKLVTSPHGTLAPWARSVSKHKKALVWPLQQRALRRADLLHATSEEEHEQIREAGFDAPVAIVPLGVPLPRLAPRNPDTLRTLLFLSRLHPIKGIEGLLDAWCAIEPLFPEWRLVVAGPGHPAYVSALTRRIAERGAARVVFKGPVHGTDKARAFRDASLFVLPTHSENFGLVVAEALSYECPVIVSQGAPWSRVEMEGCGWWVPNDAASLSDSLKTALSLPDEALQAMGVRGRAWVQREYSWSSVAGQFLHTYRWLTKGGQAPSWVRFP